MRTPTFHDVAVVGMHFRKEVDAKGIVESFDPPVELFLEREPDNEFDSYAIKVLYENIFIGYIERGQAAFISPWLDDGVKFTCTVTEMQQRKNNLHPICTIKPADAEEN